MSTPDDLLGALSSLDITPPSSPKIRPVGPLGGTKRPAHSTIPKHTPTAGPIPSKYSNVTPDPLYSFEGGLRRVSPYYYTYNTFCKERWRGKKLLEIFSTEFRDRPEEYYRKAIEAGTVCVSRTDIVGSAKAPKSGIDAIVRNGDMISHTSHRHEPPVTSKPIGVVFEDEDLVVIDKPAGMPVHPTGRYNYNSITEVMRHERGDTFNPLPCNRLDRLTSGVMFIAKTGEKAGEFMEQLRTRTVKKEYVCRVKGRFPDGDIICAEPILQISPKLGLNRVKGTGKHAKTLFRRLSHHPDLDYSIVSAHPFTGRTHQIRVHLQYLGHPIANDPIYANRRVFGASLGKDGAGDDEDIIARLNRVGKDELAEAEEWFDEVNNDYEKRKGELLTGEVCEICETPLYSDPSTAELGIYLHARRYECKEGRWAYETGLPEWATEGAGEGVIEGMMDQVREVERKAEEIAVREEAA